MPIGYVYKITANNKNYIGSTTRLVEKRIRDHYYDLLKGDICASFELMSLDDINITILEEVEYIDKLDTLLIQEEQKWIDMTQNINKKRAYTPSNWRKEEHQEKTNLWLKENKEHNKKVSLEWRLKNAEHLKLYKKSDKAKEIQKKYNKIKEMCSFCGISMCKKSIPRHIKRIHTN